MNKTEFIAAVAAKEGLEKRPPRRLSTLLSLASAMLSHRATRFRSQASALSRSESAQLRLPVTPEPARPSMSPHARFPLSRQARALRTRLQNNFAGFSGAEMPLIFLTF